jgi:hypothetical protein
MKLCVNCQKSEAEYCGRCIDESRNPINEEEKSMLLAFCITCETIIGQKNVEDHVGHHINLKRVCT